MKTMMAQAYTNGDDETTTATSKQAKCSKWIRPRERNETKRVQAKMNGGRSQRLPVHTKKWVRSIESPHGWALLLYVCMYVPVRHRPTSSAHKIHLEMADESLQTSRSWCMYVCMYALAHFSNIAWRPTQDIDSAQMLCCMLCVARTSMIVLYNCMRIECMWQVTRLVSTRLHCHDPHNPMAAIDFMPHTYTHTKGKWQANVRQKKIAIATH